MRDLASKSKESDLGRESGLWPVYTCEHVYTHKFQILEHFEFQIRDASSICKVALDL